MTMTKEATVTYDVRVVGRIWQPGFTCAQHLTVGAADLLELRQADGETDAEYLIRMVQCTADRQLGDFSSIDAWDIRRVEVREDFESLDRDGSRVEIMQRETTFTQLVGFTDDQEADWDRAMNPEDYADDEDDR